MQAKSASAIFPGAQPARHAHTQTHTGRQAIFLSPSSRKAINGSRCNIWSVACDPRGAPSRRPSTDTCLTTALAPSSPHCSHCSNRLHQEEPLVVKTPQNPTDRHRTQSQHQPLPAVRAGRGTPKSIALTFPGPPREGSIGRSVTRRQ
jgi:hypothetical protein